MVGGRYTNKKRDFYKGSGANQKEGEGISTYTVIFFYEIPGFVLTKHSWDWDWVNYSWPGRVW